MKNLNIKNIYEWPITTRLLILGLIGAAAFYLAYLYDISDLKKTLADSQQQENDLKQQYELIIHKETALTRELSRYPELQQTRAAWQRKLVNYQDMPELLNEILKIAATNHLYVSLFDPGDETTDNIYKKITIKMVVVGSYHQIGDFVSQVANMNWIVVIGNFTISNEAKNDVLGAKLAAQAGAQNLLTAELMLDVYYPPPPGQEIVPEKPKGKKPDAATPTEPTTPPPADKASTNEKV